MNRAFLDDESDHSIFTGRPNAAQLPFGLKSDQVLEIAGNES
jgi:hypothetical protein